MKKIILNTKNPMGNPTGLRIAVLVTTIVIVCVEAKLIPTIVPLFLKGKGNINILLYPLLLYIIPFLYFIWKWINLNIIHFREYRSLKKVIQSAQLIDFDDKNSTSIFGMRKVVAGVKVVYKKLNNGNIEISFYPNGIKNSDRVDKLTDRLQEAFSMTVISINQELTHTTYLLGNISANKREVHDNDF